MNIYVVVIEWDADVEGGCSLGGTYRTIKQAKKVLRGIAKENGLTIDASGKGAYSTNGSMREISIHYSCIRE